MIFADEMVALEEGAYNYVGEFINMMLTLGAVIAVILLSVWILKRLMRAKLHQLNRDASIRILEKRALGPKSALYLVDVLGKGIVLADSPSGLSLIKEFPNDVDIDTLIQEHLAAPEEPRPSLTEQLTQKFKLMASKRA